MIGIELALPAKVPAASVARFASKSDAEIEGRRPGRGHPKLALKADIKEEIIFLLLCCRFEINAPPLFPRLANTFPPTAPTDARVRDRDRVGSFLATKNCCRDIDTSVPNMQIR